MLLVVAALTTKSMMNQRSIEPGFRTRDVMTGRITLSIRDGDRQVAFFAQLEEKIAQLPGVTAASLSDGLPGTGWHEVNTAIEGRTYVRASAHGNVAKLAVTPGFFTTFDVRMSRGRPITVEDRAARCRWPSSISVSSMRIFQTPIPSAGASTSVRMTPSRRG